MSAKITLGSTLGGLVLLIIIGVIVITGSKANEENSIAAKEQSIQNNIDIQKINNTINNFIDAWFKRVEISNKNNNESRELDRQQTKNIIGNLTAHRLITNISNTNQSIILDHILNTTHALTSEEYNKAAENKVSSILGNMSADHDIIFKALNISKSDNETDAENDSKNLGQLLKEFIQDQKVKPNEPKGPKS